MTGITLSIVIPVYNEQERIAATLERVVSYFAPRYELELIAVDDGSSDGTTAVINELAGRLSQVRGLRLSRNRGKGAAVREGMLAARGAVRCFCDADLAIPEAEIEKVVHAAAQGADVAIASRALPDSAPAASPGLARALLSRLFNAAVRRGLGLPFRDTQCGCKAFRGDVAPQLFGPLQTAGFVFDVELLLAARRLGRAIVEVPVRVEPSRLSTVSLMSHAGPICRDLARLMRRPRGGPHD